MAREWIIAQPYSPSPELLAVVDGDSVVAQLLAQRGFQSAETARAFLDPAYYRPAPPEELYGLAHAVDTLWDCIQRGHNILIWGDFDVDGQTSTSLLYAALVRLAGAEHVRYHVPNRFNEGHGIRVDKLHELLSDTRFRPQCLITCDTGISDGPGIGYAKNAGLTVIVTDHHDPATDLVELARSGHAIWGRDADDVGSDSLRRADAITDPKFQPAGDPLAALPGVGVAYQLVQALFARAGRAGEEHEYLDLVALGIVADVAEQVYDTRYLLQLGLKQMRETRRIGLLALMDVAGVSPDAIDTDAIGFQLGPRLNALGRLEDATEAVELLTTADPVRAGQLAAKMERLNQQRRLLTSQITGAALTMLDYRPRLLDYDALVLGHESWHPGIVGIVAARLVEAFHKPTVLLVTPADAPARGSARSTPGVDIGASIAACSALLSQFGGHPGAAGVTLPRENVDRFREMLHHQVAEHIIPDAQDGLVIDAELPLEMATLKLAEHVNRLAPFGNGNPTPVFETPAVRVVNERRIGKQEDHRRLQVKDRSPVERTVLWWNAGDNLLPQPPIDLAYTLGVNDYRGEREVQLTYVDSRRALAPSVDSVGLPSKTVIIRDMRQQSLRAADLPQPPSAAAWYAEGVRLGDAPQSPGYAPRGGLAQTDAPTLVIWSAPPSPELLRWMQETVAPAEIVLCAVDTTDDSLASVLRQVAGMCKFAIDRDGLLDIERMAARMGTTEAVVRCSLLWLEANGAIRLGEWRDGSLSVEPGTGDSRKNANTDAKAQLQSELERELAEVRAYRRYFQRADVRALGLNGELNVEP